MPVPGEPVPLLCWPTDTPGEREMNFIFRRSTGVPDGRGGYTDVATDVAAYCGFMTETRRRGEILVLTGQGLEEEPHRIFIVEEVPDLDARVHDLLIEAADDGTESGNVIPVAGGDMYLIFGVRHYDNSTQLDVKHLLPS